MRSVPSLLVDLVAVLAFAVIGRASHGSDLGLAGIAGTAWPFLVAVVIGSLLGDRLAPAPWWRSGLIVWVVTVALGIGLRLVGGESAAPGFVVVTTAVLGLFLLGWRAVAARGRPRGTR